MYKFRNIKTIDEMKLNFNSQTFTEFATILDEDYSTVLNSINIAL